MLGLTGPVNVQAVAAAPKQPGLVRGGHAARTSSAASTAGERWAQVSRGLGEGEAHRIAFLPGNDSDRSSRPRRAACSAPATAARPGDASAAASRIADITGLAIHPDGRTLYASDFKWGGVFRSTDAGETWQRLPAEGLASDRVWTLAVDPTAADRVLAASPTGGVHLLMPAPSAAAGEGSR